jgi:hypothetical protein
MTKGRLHKNSIIAACTKTIRQAASKRKAPVKKKSTKPSALAMGPQLPGPVGIDSNGFENIPLMRVASVDGKLTLASIPPKDVPQEPEAKLSYCEEIVRQSSNMRGRDVLYEIAAGAAFHAIHKGKLYKRVDKNLGRYCDRTYHRDRATVVQWEEAATMFNDIGLNPMVMPEHYSQLRGLKRVSKERRREVWDEAAKPFGGRAPTSAQVNKTARRLGAIDPKAAKPQEREKETPRPHLSTLISSYPIESMHDAAEVARKLVTDLQLLGDISEIKDAQRLLFFIERQASVARDTDTESLPKEKQPAALKNGRKIQPISRSPMVEERQLPLFPVSINDSAA